MDFKKEIDKKANLWKIKENEGLSKNEELELKDWLENKQHEKIYEENNQIISECLSLDDDFIKKMEDEISDDKSHNNIFYKYKYTVASVTIACILVFSLLKINTHYNPSFSHNYASVDKKILHISLPDHSIVDLDVQSNMDIEYYDYKRAVVLKEGKALFSVAKNKNKPFIVKAGNTSIEVLGTKFEVIKIDDNTKINVLEGLVRVDYIENKTGNKRSIIQLKKEESMILSSKGKVLLYNKININEIANWKNDIIQFKETSLKDAVFMFSRYSDQNIKFNNHDIENLKISGKFDTSRYESFLESIQLIYPIKIEKKGEFLIISKI